MCGEVDSGMYVFEMNELHSLKAGHGDVRVNVVITAMLVLQAGAKTEARSLLGITPLMLAASSKCPNAAAIVRCLHIDFFCCFLKSACTKPALI